MAIAETARLIAALELKDDLKKGVAGAETSVRSLESRIGKMGATVGQGVKTAAHNIGLGVVAAGGLLAVGVTQGLGSLSTLESAVTSVDGAISQMGLTGKVTGQEIAGWANEIESATQAAFDDKDITAATAGLIRYGDVAAANLKPAMEVMTDLAAKTGDVSSAGTLLAKALADPEKAAGKLAKAGVVLTDQQKDEIEALGKVGDKAGQQRVLLQALADVTRGAAAASVGEYGDAQNELRDTLEDVERALAVGFLPLIKEVSEELTGAMADPAFLDKVKGFGEELAGFLRSALESAKSIPWGTIGDAMKLAGQGAHAALDLFNGLPDWVKTAVITGWGLNKLTGGALASLGSQVAGTLFDVVAKAFAGRGSTPANPLFVSDISGGLGKGAGAGGGVGGVVGGIAGAVTLGGALTLAADQLGRLPTLIQGVQEATSARTLEQWKQGFEDTVNGSTIATAFRPAVDAFKGLFPQVFGPGSPGTTPPAGDTTPHTGAAGTPFGGIASSLDDLGLRIDKGVTQIGPQFATALGPLERSFADKWGSIREELKLGNRHGAEVRREIAKGLGLTVHELVTLRGAYRSEMAKSLGLSVAEWRKIRSSAHGDDVELAAKLGLSVDQLNEIRASSRTTAAQTTNIAGKDFSPDITVPVNVRTNFSVSGRTVANATERFWNIARPRVQ